MLAGIEAGGTRMVCAVAEHPAHIRERIEIPTTTPEETFGHIRDFLKAQRSVRAIGVAAFGPVDIDKRSKTYGQVLNTPKPGWTGASWFKAFSGFTVPFKIESDVSGACLGEYAHGAGRHQKTLAYVTVGTGIGAGIVNDGRVRNGTGHYEMGHIPVRRDPDDTYGGHCPFHADCLEGLACGPAIQARWGEPLSHLGEGAVALEASYLSQLALTIILAHMPGRIIVGGGVMKTPGLIEALREQTQDRLAGYVRRGALSGDLSDYIVPPGLGEAAGVTGALLLAQQAAREAVER
ncbi:ROK family protein [Henriciella aquimarina]|uniref:ROK family protein n=1 Tax=Henriciella aquimarina TaxID=545261 RepID=UPI000A03874D|nr:ROK family protein [Henriciella aquimarina]